MATGCVRNISQFFFYSFILIPQVERGVANKGDDIEIIGFGSTKKTTLTGIGEILFRVIFQHAHDVEEMFHKELERVRAQSWELGHTG